MTRHLLTIFALTILFSCSNKQADKTSDVVIEHYESGPTKNEKQFSDGPDSSTVLTNEKKFFEAIYKKYPDNYFPLGSGGFYESYDTKSGELKWKFSFLTVDSSKNDERKYLNEIRNEVIEKYMPSLHLYVGKHSHHYELGGQVDFMAFVSGNSADFIFENTDVGFNPEFVSTFKDIIIADKNEKEIFGSNLVTVLAPGRMIRDNEYKKTGTNLKWYGDNLQVTNTYKGERNSLTSTIIIRFDKDKIADIKLKK